MQRDNDGLLSSYRQLVDILGSQGGTFGAIVGELTLYSDLLPVSYLAYVEDAEVRYEVLVRHPESAIISEGWLDLRNCFLCPL